MRPLSDGGARCHWADGLWAWAHRWHRDRHGWRQVLNGRLTPSFGAFCLRGVELSEEHGTYILIVSVAQLKRLKVGRLGTFDISPGFYAYVGSANGPGGIRARIGHHLESAAAPHWHVDYLLGIATPVEVWFAISDRKLEQDWAELLAKAPFFRSPIPRFGSSDYRRSRTSHLFYAKRQPSFRWFEDQIRIGFEAEVRPHRVVLTAQQAG